MLVHEYETIVIIRPDLDDAETEEAAASLESVINENSGTLLLRDDWGKRKLAYPIDRHLKGHYILISYVAPASAVAELERKIRINDRLVRFLTVRLADDVDVVEKMEAAKELKAQRAEEARKRAEAEARVAAEQAQNEAAIAAAAAHRAEAPRTTASFDKA